MRTLALSFAFACSISRIVAADAPQPLTEEKRAELVATWRKTHDDTIAKHKTQIEKGKVLLTNEATASTGRAQIDQANEALAAIKKDPFIVGVKLLGADVKDGWFGRLPHNVGSVVQASDTATVVDVAYNKRVSLGATGFNVPSVSDATIARFAIVPPIPKAKPKYPATLSGVWYVDGTVEVDGKAVPVLKRVEIKKDEMPGATSKKKP